MSLPEFDHDSNDTRRRKRRRNSVRVGRTHVGKGIFAQRRYTKFSIIGEIEGEVVDDPEYTSPHCFDIGDGEVLEPRSPFRFVNHSCEANCAFDYMRVKSKVGTPNCKHLYMFAVGEIRPGEELTIDYNWSLDAAIPCRCQAETCRGWIAEESQLANSRK